MTRSFMRRTALISLALVASILVLRSGAVQTQVVHVAEAFGRLRPEAVVLVLALTALSALISGVMWSKLLSKMGHDVPISVGLGAFASAGLAGYVVNIAGSAAGSVVCLRRHGVCPARAVILTMVADVLGLCGLLVWAPIGLVLVARPGMALSIPVLGSYGPVAAAITFGGLGVAMVVALKLLVSVEGTGSVVARLLLKRRAAGDRGKLHSSAPKLRMVQALRLIPWSASSWLVGTLALFVMLTALAPGNDVNLADVVGASVLAAALGSIAFFVPSGVGVRDGALIALLVHSTGASGASCAAAALALRALDPLVKFGLLLVAASGVCEWVTKHYRRGLSSATGVIRSSAGAAVLVMLARLPTPAPRPVMEAVRVERD